MKYILALIACLGILLAHGILGQLLGWRNGGGVIPILILLAALTTTWRAITKTRARRGQHATISDSHADHRRENEVATPTQVSELNPPLTAPTTAEASPLPSTAAPSVDKRAANTSHKEANSSAFNLATALPLVGALGSLIGIAEMPEDYYKLLRFLVVGGCVAVILATHRSSLREPHRTGVFLLFGLLAAVFNPVLPLELEPDSWVWLNAIAALLLLGGSVWQMRHSAFFQAHKRSIGITVIALSAVGALLFGTPPLIRWVEYQRQLTTWKTEATKSEFHFYRLGFNEPEYIKTRFDKSYLQKLPFPNYSIRSQWNGHFLEWVSSGAITFADYRNSVSWSRRADHSPIRKQLFGEDLLEEEAFDRLRQAVNSMTNGYIHLGSYSFDVASLVAFPSGDYPSEPAFSSARGKAILLLEGMPLLDGANNEGNGSIDE